MKYHQPVPELPVKDVEKAQSYYQDILGFKAEWVHPSKEMAAVSSGETSIFFRKRMQDFEPSVNWIYADKVDEMYNSLKQAGAEIVEDIEDKPWGIRQFTIRDLDGNIFYIHHDL